MEIIYKATCNESNMTQSAALAQSVASIGDRTVSSTASIGDRTVRSTASTGGCTVRSAEANFIGTIGDRVASIEDRTVRSTASIEDRTTVFGTEGRTPFGSLRNDFMRNRRRIDSENRRNYKEIYSAGILPFSVKGGTVYFLLGKDPENKWSDFGGRSEVQDNGRWDMTATREFYEESVGVVMDISSMLTRLQYKKNYIKVKGKTLSGSPYYMYVVKIPYKETYKETFDNTLGFIRYSNVFDNKYLEKIDLQWVSLETIYAGLDDENNNVVNFPLRRVFKKTLMENLQEITQFSKQFIEITENVWMKK